MPEPRPLQELEEMLEGSIDRENFEAVREHIYQSYKTVDYTDKRVKELESKVQNASEADKRELQEKLGILLVALAEHEAAIEHLEGVKRRKEACHFLGRALLAVDRAEDAISCLEKGRQGGRDFLSDMYIAEAHCRNRQWQKAETVLAPYTDSDADKPLLHYELGRTAETRGDYAEAVRCYENALGIDPDHVPSLFRLAFNRDLNGEDESAMAFYERATAQHPTYIGALINLGILYEDHGRYEEAVECYKRVLAIDPLHKQAELFLRDAESSVSMYVDEERTRRSRQQHEVLNMPLSQFEFSARSRHCLRDLEVEKLGDLVNLTAEDLLKHDNFGETSLQEVKDVLAGANLRLGANVLAQEPVSARTEGGGEAPEENPDLQVLVTELGLSTRSQRCMTKLGVGTVGELIQHTEDELLAVPNFGRTSVGEVKARLSRLGLRLKETK